MLVQVDAACAEAEKRFEQSDEGQLITIDSIKVRFILF
jgi:hypothetical protein